MSDEKSRKAAKALVDYVRQAEAIDYAYKAYYLDGPTALEFGIRDGAPYYNETELRLSEKEFRELYALFCKTEQYNPDRRYFFGNSADFIQ